MKLSEAIRLGATLKPQAYNGGSHNRGKDGSCALAAAAEAVGLERNDDNIISYYSLEELFPILKKVPSTFPDCDVISLIFDLNDSAHWTREQIADYVESIEQEQQSINSEGRNKLPKATDKAPEIDALITNFTGKDRKQTIEQGNACMLCTEPDLNFRDALSRKEYSISGMCQTCQDSVFG